MDRPAIAQADRLMLDAKKAILQEQHQRFQDLNVKNVGTTHGNNCMSP